MSPEYKPPPPTRTDRAACAELTKSGRCSDCDVTASVGWRRRLQGLPALLRHALASRLVGRGAAQRQEAAARAAAREAAARRRENSAATAPASARAASKANGERAMKLKITIPPRIATMWDSYMDWVNEPIWTRGRLEARRIDLIIAIGLRRLRELVRLHGRLAGRTPRRTDVYADGDGGALAPMRRMA